MWYSYDAIVSTRAGNGSIIVRSGASKEVQVTATLPNFPAVETSGVKVVVVDSYVLVSSEYPVFVEPLTGVEIGINAAQVVLIDDGGFDTGPVIKQAYIDCLTRVGQLLEGRVT